MAVILFSSGYLYFFENKREWLIGLMFIASALGIAKDLYGWHKEDEELKKRRDTFHIAGGSSKKEEPYKHIKELLKK
ncbi:hypothetical protein HYV88_01485 [Candidatus Woesearchaeota archaeon]|nr:hypothetical protein [Candidatus Woesearchaeota archaeon]